MQMNNPITPSLVSAVKADDILLRLIPYYAWCNRGASEMTVWLPAL